MGNNPSKSQQLQSAFPEFRILSDLSLSSDNKYELIFVGREGQKEIYAIKETLKEPALLNYLKTVQPQVRTYGDINKCSEVVQILECKKIDSMFYTLYEWLPTSLPSYLASTSEPPSRSLCMYIMLTLLKVYAMLWKNCEGYGLDITPNNIRVAGGLSLQNSLPSIKVLPPSITHSFSKKESSNNSIKNLGDVLAVLLSGGKHISDIMTFINQRMRAPGVSTTLATWEALEKDSSMFTQPHRPSLTPVKREQEGRSVSPIPQNVKFSPLPLQPGHIATITRPVSPISISRITYSRDLSPQQSRISTYKSQYQVHNNTKPIENVYQTSVSPGKIVNRVEQFHSSEHMVGVNSAKNLHQHHEPLTLHQRYPSEQGSTPSYNYSNSTPNTNKFIPISPHNMKAEKYETTILDPERELGSLKLTSPSPSPSLISPSPFCYDKRIVTNNKVMNHFRNENGNPISNFTPQYYTHSETKISTPRERNFNITNNPIKTIKPVSPTKNTQKVQLINNGFMGLTTDLQVIETKNQINSSISIPSMFTPSLPDPIQIRPKIGIPSLDYVPKTTQDKHDESEEKEEKKESLKSSFNLFGSGENFIEKHLLAKNQETEKELLCSSIPVINDKESSFGLTVSEDSDSGINYEGVYEGSFHPNFPTIRHGVGKLIFPSGGSYHGNFSWNKMDGWGKLFYPSGRLAYEGYWKHSKFEGYGKLFNENPLHIDIFDYTDFNKAQTENEDGYWKYYEGNMKNDMKEGHGVWVMENGEKYDGQFHLDMVHGIGIFHGKKGNMEGTWENNYLLSNSKKARLH